MSYKHLLIAGLAALASVGSAAESAAQARRVSVPARRVVVVPTYVRPLWYYDPRFYDPFYDYQWGGIYGPYGYPPYHRYAMDPGAAVKLEVKPKQAEVYVDGYYAGVVDDFDGTFQRLRITPGEHEIELYLDGYRAVHQTVYLQPDNTFKLKYEMEKLGGGEPQEPRPQPASPPPPDATPGGAPQPPAYPAPPPRGSAGRRPPQAPPAPRDRRPGDASAYGTLSIRVQPADAQILVDGERWSSPEGQDRVVIDVPEGRHSIEIQKPGYRSYMTDVEIRRGETTPLNVSLRQDEN